jgi:hypothetical protein
MELNTHSLRRRECWHVPLVQQVFVAFAHGRSQMKSAIKWFCALIVGGII